MEIRQSLNKSAAASDIAQNVSSRDSGSQINLKAPGMLLLSMAVSAVTVLSGCASQLPDTSVAALSSSSTTTSSSIYVSTQVSSLSPGQTTLVTATGGTAPYTYTLTNAADSTITAAAGVFTAGSIATTATIIATDSTGASNFASIAVLGSGSGTGTGGGTTTMTYAAGALSQAAGSPITLKDGSHLTLGTDGNLVFFNAAGTNVWNSGTPSENCSTCKLTFTSGNLAIIYNGITIWNTATTGTSMVVSETAPYIKITDASGNIQWSTNNTSGTMSLITFNPGTLTMTQNNRMWIDGGYAVFQTDGNFVVDNSSGVAVTSTASGGHSCGSNCTFVFQSDGNLVGYMGTTAFFSSNTSHTGAYFQISNTSPFLRILNSSGTLIWYK